MDDIKKDLAQVARLALAEQTDDVRLFVARLVRKYRNHEPDLSSVLDEHLRSFAPKSGSFMRRSSARPAPPPTASDTPPPVDDESRLSLLKVFRDDHEQSAPLLTQMIEDQLKQLIAERQQSKRLTAAGLHPTRSAIFVGAPGVGKTITARWLAAQLGVPLFVLDLTAVMSSLLGRSGSNIRAALDYAKRTPCVLLLDEIDAIAKRRNDDSDIGELKRLVTVILQEVDEWPSTGLLLAATNHPEIIDPALWRRFDLVIEFKSPDPEAVKIAVQRFLGPDADQFEDWIDILSSAFHGFSFSDIEREIRRFRRSLALGTSTSESLMEAFIRSRAQNLDRHARIDLAVALKQQTSLSQHNIHEVTGVSRDTIRKYSSETVAKPDRPSRKKTSV